MKPFNELTRLGRIRRMRQLAALALMSYGVDEAHFYLVRQAGNTLFRVKTSNLPRPEAPDGLFEEGQYLLRVHEPGYQEPEAIDFDSGFGYWVFDLAVALDACRDDPAYPRYREALLDGYAEFRSLPEKQAEQLELFLAGLQVYWNLWAVGGTHLYPSLLPEYSERIARTAEFVVRYARQKGCPV